MCVCWCVQVSVGLCVSVCLVGVYLCCCLYGCVGFCFGVFINVCVSICLVCMCA
jgi:hypothetical protein